jgi:hypothetical protein
MEELSEWFVYNEEYDVLICIPYGVVMMPGKRRGIRGHLNIHITEKQPFLFGLPNGTISVTFTRVASLTHLHITPLLTHPRYLTSRYSEDFVVMIVIIYAPLRIPSYDTYVLTSS